MFNIFKIKIPKDNAQVVTEVESFTVTWEVLSGWSNSKNKHHKVFVNRDDAKEFEKQLNECGKFINASIWTRIDKN